MADLRQNVDFMKQEKPESCAGKVEIKAESCAENAAINAEKAASAESCAENAEINARNAAKAAKAEADAENAAINTEKAASAEADAAKVEINAENAEKAAKAAKAEADAEKAEINAENAEKAAKAAGAEADAEKVEINAESISEDKPKRSIARSAAAMGAATFLSRIAGLVREQTFAYLFGAGSYTDAFNVAFRIPNMLRDLFAEGAMSAAFVPTFNGILKKDGKEQALKLTNLTFCALLVVVGALTVLGIIFSPQIVSLIAPEFCNNPDKFNVTVTMTRIMCPFLLVISWAAVSMGLLNSLGEFFIPSAAPIFLNLSMIIAGFTLCPLAKKLDMPAITGMAIGAMLGGALQFLAQLPAVMRHGFKFKWVLNFKDPGIKRIIKLMIPGTVGLAATQINVAVSTILSTSQGDGAVSWLSYSFRITQLPLGLFGVAVAQATLPVISRQAADNDKSAMASTIADSMRLSGFINLFSCFAIMALAEPAVRILFQHGRFGPADTLATAIALRANVSGLLFFSLIKILGPAFYALNETKTPVIASVCAVVSNIALNLLFIKPFGYWGLALGTSLSAVINFGVLFFVIQKRLGSFAKYGLISGMTKIFAAAFASGALMYSLYPRLEVLIAGFHGSLAQGGVINATAAMLIALTLGTALLYALSALLKIEEAAQAKKLIVQKLLKKRTRK